MALAYAAAKMVVGWLGPRDATSDTAVQVIRAIDEACPPRFGEPGDRRAHPDNYGPEMVFLEGVAHLWDLRSGGDPLGEMPTAIAVELGEHVVQDQHGGGSLGGEQVIGRQPQRERRRP